MPENNLTPVLKNCRNCGSEFNPTRSTQIHCCKRCSESYHLFHSQTLVEVECFHCKKPFRVTPQRFKAYSKYFCSPTCSKKTPEERFWSFVIKQEGCWGWRGKPDKHGYGKIKLPDGTSIKAHRLSWEIHFGKIPEGLCVLHRCDNPTCCNPEDLWLGTVPQNNKDRDEKGRQVKGVRVNTWKYDPNLVIESRKMFAAGVRPTDISKTLNIPRDAVYRFIHFKQWKHLARGKTSGKG